MSDEDRHLPPWAIWTVFRNAPQWWFARGCPPPLWEGTRWERAIKTSLVLGLLGAATGATGILWQVLANQLFNLDVAIFLPGVWFGLVALIPLSRWSGRNWWSALAAVMVSGAAYWTAIMVFLSFAPPFGSGTKSEELGGLCGGAAAGLIYGIWFVHWKPVATRLPFLAAFAGAVGGLWFVLSLNWERSGSPTIPFADEWLGMMVWMGSYAFYQSLMCIALGVRLWWDEGEIRNEEL